MRRFRFKRVRPVTQPGWIVFGILSALALASPPTSTAAPYFGAPGSMVILDDGATLAAAFERFGEIRFIDTESGRSAMNLALGEQITGLVAVPGRNRLLAAISNPDELVLLSAEKNPRILARHPLSGNSGSLAITANGKRAAVGLPALREIRAIRLEGDRLEAGPVSNLDFTPGALLFFRNEDCLLAADNFGGELAAIETASGKTLSRNETPFHNIRGLAVSPDRNRVLISHQQASSLARSSFDDLHWGGLMKNRISSVPFDWFFDSPLKWDGVHELDVGDVNRAAGDPADLRVDSKWRIYVALSGVNEVGIFEPGNREFVRIPVGHRPRTLLLDETRERLYVANTLSDSISVIDTGSREVIRTFEFGVRPRAIPAPERGERLFFDARLSHDGWMSCHSCHSEGHTNGRLADTLGDGAHGSPKRVLSLLGVRDTPPYAWDGSFPDLESQIAKTVDSTMHRGKSLTGEQTADLVAFLESLEPPEPKPARMSAASGRGRALFTDRLRCRRCHDPEAAYTSPDTYDVGLTDELDNKSFNPPSLRGAGRRDRFFHDGRADTLKGVFSEHRHQLEEVELSTEELEDLIAFLKTL